MGKHGSTRGAKVVPAFLTAGGLLVSLLCGGCKKSETKVAAPTTAPAAATQPAATAPATPPAKPPEPPVVRTYLDVVLANHPTYPTTQPLSLPVNMNEAAHLVVKEWVYLDPSSVFLWVTRPDAPPTPQVLKDPPGDPENVMVTRERVVFVHWTVDDAGAARPNLVCPRSDGEGYEVVSKSGRRPIGAAGRAYRWDRARSWNTDRIMVPSATGMSVIDFAPEKPEFPEQYQDLVDPDKSAPPASRPVEVTAGDAPAPSSQPAAVAETEDQTKAEGAAELAEPQFLLDFQGMLAFIPWEPGKRGGRGAARFADGKWTALGPSQGWPEKVLHLIPLLDGSVMQFVVTSDGPGADEAAEDRADAAREEQREERARRRRGERVDPAERGKRGPRPQSVRLAVASLTGESAVERGTIENLVADLSAEEEKARDTAFEELTKYGPGIWPIIKELIENQPPEAQARMRQLLKNQVAPLLGGMQLLGHRLQLVTRHADGGAVFYAPGGVALGTNEDGQPIVQVPAWLGVRPGQAVQLLPDGMTGDLLPGKAEIQGGSRDEWIVVADARGPRRWVGNALVTMLRREEADAGFTHWIGTHRRGRWLFRKPLEAPLTGREDLETLIIDQTLPDITPRLPIWHYTTADEVGWDKDDWPAVRWMETRNRLKERDWVPLEENETLFSKPEEIPPPVVDVLPTTMPTTSPTTRPTTGPAATQLSASTRPALPPVSESYGPPLLTLRDGTRYFGGVTELRAVSRDGGETTWPLPAISQGKEGSPVHLVRTPVDGRLYLFNQPGRVLRLKPTPEAAEPFVIEATFTKNVPSVASPTRIWLDPAGRIIVAYESKLAILFPTGYIPPQIRQKMIGAEDVEEE